MKKVSWQLEETLKFPVSSWLILRGYSLAISSHYPLAWFCPDPRGVLKFEDLHVSRSLKKLLRQNKYDVTFNERFEEVIQHCSSTKNRKGQMGTWITKEIMMAYTDLFYAGHAYSVEVIDKKENSKVGFMEFISINLFPEKVCFLKSPTLQKLLLLDL